MRVRDVLFGAAVGAATAYFLDPDNGARRRHLARDRGLATGRDVAREAERKARYAGGVVEGAVAKATPGTGGDAEELNDPALASKVESEIFRAPDAPKDKVDVNVENHVVYLRGRLDSGDQAKALVEAARQVDGVRDVESLIDVGPGTSRGSA
jgi:osmotically-inducible protein OsmY